MPVLLSPLGGLVALAAVLPLVAALVRERRLRGLRRTLGLGSPGRGAFATALAGAAAVALLGLAAAQPALSRTRGVAVRTDAQAYAIFDTTRSMLAVRHRGGRTRFERARQLAVGIRDALPQVPWGVASFADRALVAVFPTGDRSLFAATVEQSVGVQRPAPGFKERNATALQALSDLGHSGFYAPGVKRRFAVVFTDAETQPISPRVLGSLLATGHVRVVVVRLWSPGDRVYDARGHDEGYRPDPSTRQLAALRSAGMTVVPEQSAATEVPALLRRWLGSGPTGATTSEAELVPLAPEAILAAIVPFGFVLVRSRR